MSDGKKKTGGRVVISNVRVTKETHLRMKVLADLWHMPMSDMINKLIDECAPNVDEVIRQRKEQERLVSRESKSSDN